MKNELTIKEQFAMVKNVLVNAGEDKLADFVQTRIDLLDKKSANRKPKVKTDEELAFAADVLASVPADGATVTDIIKNMASKNDAYVGLSTQRVTAALKASDAVVNVKDGKKSLYKLA